MESKLINIENLFADIQVVSSTDNMFSALSDEDKEAMNKEIELFLNDLKTL